MERRHFNKVIKQAFASNGLLQSKRGEYAIISAQRDYYVIIKIPDMIKGFVIGIMPKEIESFPEFKETWLRYYGLELELCFADRRDYSDDEIEESVKNAISTAIAFSESGKDGIVNNINEWMFTGGEPKKNEIRIWLGLPAVDPYSSEYLEEQVDLLRRGGFARISLNEFSAHESFYRKFEEYGFSIIVDNKNNVVIIQSNY